MLGLQKSVGNAAVARVLQRFARVPLPSTNKTELLAQERFPDAGGDKPTSFLRKEKINVVAKTTGNVLVSENGRMAIEETKLAERQAKEFYADPELVDESNKKLIAVGSQFVLDVSDAKQLLVPTAAGAKSLSQVVPKRVLTGMSAGRTQGQRTDPVDVAATCDLVAGSIAGEIQNLPARLKDADLDKLGITRARDAEYRIAAFVLAYLEAPGDDRAKRTAGRAALEADVPPTGVEDIAKKYGSIPKDDARKAALSLVAEQLGLNEFATARVGDVLATISLGQPGDDKKFEDYATGKKRSVAEGEIWATHFGAVVAKDGEDVMTLQNYARHAEAKGVPQSEGEQTPGDDPRWYFQMYGPRQRQKDGTTDDQSWHAAWTGAARGFVNPLSFAIGARETPAGFTPDADAAISHGVAIGAIKPEDALTYRARQWYLLTTEEQDALLAFRAPKPGFGRQALNVVGLMDPASLVRLRIHAGKVGVIRAVFSFGFQKAKDRKGDLEALGISSFHPSEDANDRASNLGNQLIALGIPRAYVKDTLKLKPAP